MVQGAIAIVQDADAIPELGILLEQHQPPILLFEEHETYLGVWEEIECLLVRGIGLLQVVLHEVAVAQCAPYFAILFLESQHTLKVFDCLNGKYTS